MASSTDLSVRHFFDSANGPIFASANYTGTQFQTKLGNHRDNSEIKGTLLDQLMIQAGRDTVQPGAQPNDLHSDFVDFVIKTAVFHRNMDKPTGEREGKNPLVQALEGSLRKHVGDTDVKSAGHLDASSKGLKTDWGTVPAGGDAVQHFLRLVQSAADNTKVVDGDHSKDTMRDGLAAKLAEKAVNDAGSALPGDAKTDVQNALTKGLKDALDNALESVKSTANAAALEAAMGNVSEGVILSAANVGASGVSNKYATAHTPAPGASAGVLLGPIRQWESENMNSDVRKFYSAFVNVIKKNGGVWDADGIPEDQYKNVVDNGEYRVNLKKVPGTGKILFGETLPLTEVGVTAFYNGGAGKERVSSATYLQDLYDAVYRGDDSHGNGSAGGIFNVTSNLVRNLLRAQTAVDSVKAPSGRDVSLDDYSFEDISTGTMWHRDADKGLYRMVDGERKYAKDDVNNLSKDDNCYGTGLKAKCDKVMQCLVDGDSKSLGACLEAHADSDMWAVAENDLKNLHPNMAVFVLKKFGIKGVHATTANGIKVVVPMEFGRWLNGLEASQRESIKSNEQLCNYLKALIAFLRREPKILNKGLSDDRHGGVPESRPAYIKDLGLCQYKEPVKRESSMGFSAQLIRNMQPYSAPLLGVHFGDRYSEATNARMGFGMLGGSPMAGGCYHVGGVRPSEFSRTLDKRSNDGRVKCAAAHAHMLNNLKRELNSVGHTLSGDDEARIQKAIENMADLEGKLGKLHDILSKFIEVGQAFGIDYSKHADKPLKDVDINNIKDTDSLVRYLATNVDEMKTCINNNAQVQANINNELMSKIYAQMLESGSGSNDGLVELN